MPDTRGVDVTKFGAMGDGTTNDLQAFKDAVGIAVDLNRPLLVPAGTYKIQYSGTDYLEVNGDLTVLGDGQDNTVLQFGPSPVTFGYYGFNVTAPATLRISDLTLAGPASAGSGGQNSPFTAAVHSKYDLTSVTEPINYYLRNVTINGKWQLAVNLQNSAGGNSPDTLIDIDSCDLSAYTGAIAQQLGDNAKQHWCVVRNTYFRKAGLSAEQNEADGGPAVAYGHHVYNSPNVSNDFDGCLFGENFRYSIHLYGSPDDPPAFVRVRGCTFLQDTHQGILLPGVGENAVVENCAFHGSQAAVVVQGNATVRNCIFDGAEGVTWISGSSREISIQGCRFLKTGAIAVYVRGENNVWRISDCTFRAPLAAGVSLIFNGTEAGTELFVENCQFRLTANGLSGSQGLLLNRGRNWIRNCKFSDYSPGNGSPWISFYSTSMVQTHLEGNYFDGGAYDPYDVTSGSVTGWGNYFAHVADRNTWQSLQLREYVHQSVLASASTLNWPLSSDTAHVNGTSTINNILISNSTNVTKHFSCPITIIADAAFTLANNGGGTGNIRLKGAANRTMAVNEAITLTHDGQTALWYEVD